MVGPVKCILTIKILDLKNGFLRIGGKVVMNSLNLIKIAKK